jgi:hypothetical protein
LELSPEHNQTCNEHESIKGEEEFAPFMLQESLDPVISTKIIIIKDTRPVTKKAERSQNTNDSQEVHEEESHNKSHNTKPNIETPVKCNRVVDPQNFLSLKRKDVVMKSIFRMMRRYYCKLLEDATGYNRKEKCLQIKHQELIKNIDEGMKKLNFSTFSNNMSFYFAAFAYPSDMRKILEEAKQQYRTQNELLSQAIYIVQLVDNCFNRFSKKVLNDMLSIPQFSYFINYYLTNIDDLMEYPKPFQNCHKTLIKAKDQVAGYKEGTIERISRQNTFVLRDEFFLFNRSDSL